jgi:hypothetical protein
MFSVCKLLYLATPTISVGMDWAASVRGRSHIGKFPNSVLSLQNPST